MQSVSIAESRDERSNAAALSFIQSDAITLAIFIWMARKFIDMREKRRDGEVSKRSIWIQVFFDHFKFTRQVGCFGSVELCAQDREIGLQVRLVDRALVRAE